MKWMDTLCETTNANRDLVETLDVFTHLGTRVGQIGICESGEVTWVEENRVLVDEYTAPRSFWEK